MRWAPGRGRGRRWRGSSRRWRPGGTLTRPRHGAFIMPRPGIETAMPFPRILIMGIAAADRDRAGVHIPVVDVPAFLAGFSRSTAGEFRHTPLKRGLSGCALISGPVIFRGGSLLAERPTRAALFWRLQRWRGQPSIDLRSGPQLPGFSQEGFEHNAGEDRTCDRG